MRYQTTCLASIIFAASLYAFGQSPNGPQDDSKADRPAGKKATDKTDRDSDATADQNKPAKDRPAEKDKKADKGKPADSEKQADKAGGGLKLGIATESEKLLDDAIAKVEAIKKFHADVRQKTEMLGYTFSAEGQYAIAPDLKVLYELKVQLTNDTTGSIKEVCDGRTHWRNQKVLDTQELVRMDVKKLREVFDKPQFNKDVRDQLLRQLGFSGMVPLMRGLRETQKFDSHEEGSLGGEAVYVLKGQWREAAIAQSAFRGQQLSMSKLAQFPFVPTLCTVWIGKENGWLHKAELEGEKPVQGSVTRITFEFLNPRFDEELPEALFAFEPPSGVRAEDQTDVMYQRLSAILQQAQNSDRGPAGAPAGPLGEPAVKAPVNAPTTPNP